MKKIYLLSIGLILITNYSFSQLKLDIEINGISNDTGNIMLELFDENEKVLTQEISTIKNNMCLISINNLKSGKYAIRYYHDENLNGLMETNMFGKPTEGYGFSNNVIGKSGPPPFEKWLFEITENTKIELRPTY
jgi:uncharacterized protein (DUF2141 family)